MTLFRQKIWCYINVQHLPYNLFSCNIRILYNIKIELIHIVRVDCHVRHGQEYQKHIKVFRCKYPSHKLNISIILLLLKKRFTKRQFVSILSKIVLKIVCILDVFGIFTY